MFCPHCGKEIDNNDAFCSFCGKRVSFSGGADSAEWNTQAVAEFQTKAGKADQRSGRDHQLQSRMHFDKQSGKWIRQEEEQSQNLQDLQNLQNRQSQQDGNAWQDLNSQRDFNRRQNNNYQQSYNYQQGTNYRQDNAYQQNNYQQGSYQQNNIHPHYNYRQDNAYRQNNHQQSSYQQNNIYQQNNSQRQNQQNQVNQYFRQNYRQNYRQNAPYGSSDSFHNFYNNNAFNGSVPFILRREAVSADFSKIWGIIFFILGIIYAFSSLIILLMSLVSFEISYFFIFIFEAWLAFNLLELSSITRLMPRKWSAEDSGYYYILCLGLSISSIITLLIHTLILTITGNNGGYFIWMFIFSLIANVVFIITLNGAFNSSPLRASILSGKGVSILFSDSLHRIMELRRIDKAEKANNKAIDIRSPLVIEAARARKKLYIILAILQPLLIALWFNGGFYASVESFGSYSQSASFHYTAYEAMSGDAIFTYLNVFLLVSATIACLIPVALGKCHLRIFVIVPIIADIVILLIVGIILYALYDRANSIRMVNIGLTPGGFLLIGIAIAAFILDIRVCSRQFRV